MRALRPSSHRFSELVDRELDFDRPALPETTESATAAAAAAIAVAEETSEAVSETGRGAVRDAGTAGEPAARDWLRTPPRDLFGLALSGGGIRSATFNLGLLQGLAPLGLLRSLDYLSTVSGGGYIGGFWTSWRRQNDGVAEFPTVDEPSDPMSPSPSEAPPIRRLREFGNFLSPRLGLFSVDTGRMVAALFASMIPSLLAAAALIAIVTFVWLGLATIVLEPSLWGLGSPASPFGSLGLPTSVAVSVLGIVLLTGAILLVTELIWRRKEQGIREPEYVAVSVVALVLVAAAWLLVAPRTAPGAVRPLLLWGDVSARALVFSPPVAWTAAAVALVFVRFAASALVGRIRVSVAYSAIDRALSRLLFTSAVWLVVAVLWIAARYMVDREEGLVLEAFGAGGTAAIGLAITRLQAMFSQQPNKPAGSRLMAFIRPRLPQLLSYGFVALLTVLVMAGTGALAVHAGSLPVLGGALGITLLTLLFFTPNEVGLHAFYRGRLSRAFLGAASARGDDDDRRTEVQPGDDFPLTDAPARAPLHLVCCAANDLAQNRQFLHLHRGADSAVLSRAGFSVGSNWQQWPEDGHATTMGDAITASAAAFNSQMGSWSVKLGPAAVFTLAALNLRLGLWLEHPEEARDRRGWSRVVRSLRGLPFYKEMLGMTRADGAHVHLSDGGHFENMALYELIRRHCRYIVASDCGADPDVAFDDLGNVVRRVREDFDVEISIDLSPLRPAEGRARQPMVAGDILYPDGDTGVLLLFKPTLIGDEPPDVTQYSTRNHRFPHESTGDQFYDEAQWESYRRLGLHAARSAFRFVRDPGHKGETAEEARKRCARIFAQARFDWMPPPRGFAQGMDGIVKSHEALDEILRMPEAATLWKQVFRDFAEADGASPGRPGVTEELATIPLLREVIRHMEQIFHLAQLDHYSSHPINLGTMNVFGRWTAAPVFREWWPMLRGLYSSPFAGFMERTFSLRSLSDATIAELDGTSRTGFAVDALRTARGAGYGFGDHSVLAFHALRSGDRRAGGGVSVQLAALVCDRFEHDDRPVMTWDAADFFVPPGLWGIGIGNQFLGSLTDRPEDLLVRIRKPGDGGRDARKTAADLAQMYRSAAFTDVEAEDRLVRAAVTRARVYDSAEFSGVNPGDPKLRGAVEPRLEAAARRSFRWLLRRAAAPAPKVMA